MCTLFLLHMNVSELSQLQGSICITKCWIQQQLSLVNFILSVEMCGCFPIPTETLKWALADSVLDVQS